MDRAAVHVCGPGRCAVKRPHRVHGPIAEGLRALPGQWGEVGPYPARYSAQSTAQAIRKGELPAYQPSGSFDAEVRSGAEGEPTVWARFVGAEVAA